MSARCCCCYRIVLPLCEDLNLAPATRHGLWRGRGVANFPPNWQAGWYVLVSPVSFGRVGHFFLFFSVEAHGSRHGMPSEPPRDPTGAHVVFHGRPWGPMGAHDSCHRSPRPPTGPHEKTAGGHYSYHRGMYIVFQRALVGVPVATPTEPKWEPTRHVMAARVGPHVAAHMAAHVACRKQWIKKIRKPYSRRPW